MYLKLNSTEFFAMFPDGVNSAGEVEINGNKFYTTTLKSYSYNYREWYPEEAFVELDLQMIIPIKPKSKEQLAAEESVRKAEEALQAAKSTLEKIKEK